MLPRLYALLAVLLWGVSFVATKAILRELAPLTLITSRFALGAATLLVILLIRRRPLVPPRDTWRMLVVLALIGVVVHQLIQAYGLTLTTAVRTGWLIGTIPIWSALLAAWILRERFTGSKVAGLILGFVGVVLVVTRGRTSAEFLALPATRGDFLILASAINWAVYTVVSRGTIRRIGGTRTVAAFMFCGWLMLTPVLLIDGQWRQLATLSGVGWVALLFLGIGCSGLAYLLWHLALERITATQVAAFLYVEPLSTLIAAMYLLGETVQVSTIAGGLLVLGGVFLVQRAPARQTGSSRGSDP